MRDVGIMSGVEIRGVSKLRGFSFVRRVFPEGSVTTRRSSGETSLPCCTLQGKGGAPLVSGKFVPIGLS